MKYLTKRQRKRKKKMQIYGRSDSNYHRAALDSEIEEDMDTETDTEELETETEAEVDSPDNSNEVEQNSSSSVEIEENDVDSSTLASSSLSSSSFSSVALVAAVLSAQHAPEQLSEELDYSPDTSTSAQPQLIQRIHEAVIKTMTTTTASTLATGNNLRQQLQPQPQPQQQQQQHLTNFDKRRRNAFQEQELERRSEQSPAPGHYCSNHSSSSSSGGGGNSNGSSCSRSAGTAPVNDREADGSSYHRRYEPLTLGNFMDLERLDQQRNRMTAVITYAGACRARNESEERSRSCSHQRNGSNTFTTTHWPIIRSHGHGRASTAAAAAGSVSGSSSGSSLSKHAINAIEQQVPRPVAGIEFVRRFAVAAGNLSRQELAAFGPLIGMHCPVSFPPPEFWQNPYQLSFIDNGSEVSVLDKNNNKLSEAFGRKNKHNIKPIGYETRGAKSAGGSTNNAPAASSSSSSSNVGSSSNSSPNISNKSINITSSSSRAIQNVHATGLDADRSSSYSYFAGPHLKLNTILSRDTEREKTDHVSYHLRDIVNHDNNLNGRPEDTKNWSSKSVGHHVIRALENVIKDPTSYDASVSPAPNEGLSRCPSGTVLPHCSTISSGLSRATWQPTPLSYSDQGPNSIVESIKCIWKRNSSDNNDNGEECSIGTSKKDEGKQETPKSLGCDPYQAEATDNASYFLAGLTDNPWADDLDLTQSAPTNRNLNYIWQTQEPPRASNPFPSHVGPSTAAEPQRLTNTFSNNLSTNASTSNNFTANSSSNSSSGNNLSTSSTSKSNQAMPIYQLPASSRSTNLTTPAQQYAQNVTTSSYNSSGNNTAMANFNSSLAYNNLITYNNAGVRVGSPMMISNRYSNPTNLCSQHQHQQQQYGCNYQQQRQHQHQHQHFQQQQRHLQKQQHQYQHQQQHLQFQQQQHHLQHHQIQQRQQNRYQTAVYNPSDYYQGYYNSINATTSSRSNSFSSNNNLNSNRNTQGYGRYIAHNNAGSCSSNNFNNWSTELASSSNTNTNTSTSSNSSNSNINNATGICNIEPFPLNLAPEHLLAAQMYAIHGERFFDMPMGQIYKRTLNEPSTGGTTSATATAAAAASASVSKTATVTSAVQAASAAAQSRSIAMRPSPSIPTASMYRPGNHNQTNWHGHHYHHHHHHHQYNQPQLHHHHQQSLPYQQTAPQAEPPAVLRPAFNINKANFPPLPAPNQKRSSKD